MSLGWTLGSAILHPLSDKRHLGIIIGVGMAEVSTTPTKLHFIVEYNACIN